MCLKREHYSPHTLEQPFRLIYACIGHSKPMQTLLTLCGLQRVTRHVSHARYAMNANYMFKHVLGCSKDVHEVACMD